MVSVYCAIPKLSEKPKSRKISKETDDDRCKSPVVEGNSMTFYRPHPATLKCSFLGYLQQTKVIYIGIGGIG